MVSSLGWKNFGCIEVASSQDRSFNTCNIRFDIVVGDSQFQDVVKNNEMSQLKQLQMRWRDWEIRMVDEIALWMPKSFMLMIIAAVDRKALSQVPVFSEWKGASRG